MTAFALPLCRLNSDAQIYLFLRKCIGKHQPVEHDLQSDWVCEAKKCCKSHTCTTSDLFENIQ
ncbi:hypothetical protein CA603_48900 [Paraburkholderia hospita]|nr:hypothetical protein CA603_48900 [Paraburkholderia hospita]